MSILNISYPPGVKASFQSALDQFMQLEQQDCILYFPGTAVPVSGSQSIGAPVGTDMTNSVWAGGSPLPISNQYNQPYEGSIQDYVQVETTGVIQMVVYPNPSRFSDVFPVGERSPAGLVGTRGYTSDLHHLLNATHVEMYNNIAGKHFKYKLAGEPIFPGTLVADRYFYAIFERVGS